MISSNNPITRPSNLTFWYSDSDTISKITTTTFGSSNIEGSNVLQTHSGIITDKQQSDEDVKPIGSFTQMKNCIVKTKDSAFVNNSSIFFLEGGNIQFQPIGIQSFNNQGHYGLAPNQTYIFRITNGSNDYVNANGFIVIRSFDNLDREIKIYFD